MSASWLRCSLIRMPSLCPAGMSRFFGGRRLRPLLTKKHKDLRFAFDHVFDETSSQTEVLRHTTQAIIDGVLDGINSSVFAYGATGEWWGGKGGGEGEVS